MKNMIIAALLVFTGTNTLAASTSIKTEILCKGESQGQIIKVGVIMEGNNHSGIIIFQDMNGITKNTIRTATMNQTEDSSDQRLVYSNDAKTIKLVATNIDEETQSASGVLTINTSTTKLKVDAMSCTMGGIISF